MAGMITSTETTLHPVSQALPPHQPPPLVRPLNGSGGDAGTTVSGPPNASRLTIDDISKHFNVPIAEAATALGVCSSVLKRICRENSIVRWPYRKFLAGKTVDDIKKDAAREKSRELAELSKSSSTSTMPNLSTTSSIAQDGPKFGKPNLGTVHVHNKAQFSQGPGLFQPVHVIPDYIDEFSYGFPTGGLALSTRQWWSMLDSEAASSDDDDDEAFDESNCSSASSSLCSLRRKAVQDGEKSLRSGVSMSYKRGTRERSLIKIFGSSLPLER